MASRADVEREIDIAQPHAVVSIRCPGSDTVALAKNPHTGRIMRLCFHDVDRWPSRALQSRLCLPVVMFDTSTAASVAAFVRECVAAGVDALMVQCEMGISRSAAVAAAVDQCVNGNDCSEFDRSEFDRHATMLTDYSPNPLVRRLMVDALQMGTSDHPDSREAACQR